MPDTRTFGEIQDELREALRDAYGDQGYVWLRDCSADLCWFEISNSQSCTLWQAAYSIDGDDLVSFDNVVEVEPVVTYEEVGKAADAALDAWSMEAAFEAVQKNEDEGLIFGWANVAVRKDGTVVVDSDGEHVPIEDLETAAYVFTLKYRATGADHAGEVRGELVESVVFTDEKIAAMGLEPGSIHKGWWVGFHLDDPADYQAVKSGDKGMFSIQGTARKVLV